MSNLDISLSRSHFHGSSPNVWPASPFCWPSPSSPSLEALGGCAQQTKMTTVFFSSKMIRESVNVFCVLFVYWWNMLQACHSQSRAELTSCVCSLARELSPFKRRDLWEGFHEFIMLFLTSRISSFSCSCTNPLGFSKDMFRQSSIRSLIRGHPPSSLRGNWCSAEASIPSWSSLGQ